MTEAELQKAVSEDRFIHIRNWDRFQHRDVTRNKKSAAPWIMDHVAQLHDDDWLALTLAQRGILQSLRLMYAARRGRGVNEALARRFISTTKAESRRFREHIEALNDAGFIEFSARELCADSRQKARLDVDVDVDKNSFHPSVVRDEPPNGDGWMDEQSRITPIDIRSAIGGAR